MKRWKRALPTLFLVCAGGLLVAACGDDTTTKPDFASVDNDMSANDDLAGSDLKLVDQAVPDLTPVGPSGMIQQVRNMADSSSTPDGGMISLPVQDVFVTGLRPLVMAGADPAGFFVQADKAGPALFVAVDPATLSPAPQIGDLVRFNATSVQKLSGTRQAGSIDMWTVVSSGNSTATLVQDVTSSTDLVTGLENYESELVKIGSATIASAFASSATGYVAATITTAGIPTMSTKLKLRIPSSVREALDLNLGCVLAVGPTPLWRFFDTTEPSAWVASELVVASCPAPRVLSAVATDDHTVVVTFDRILDAATLIADGRQFTFTGGLTASAAAFLTTSSVTVTTTTQTAATVYTATVAATLTDKRGTGIDAAHSTANFSGFVTPAVLVLNELSLNITGGRDLIELKAISGGSLAGFSIYQDFTAGERELISALPALVVATGDLVVVHLNPVAAGPTTETNAGGKAGCVDATCVAAAWDVNGSTTKAFPISRRIVVLTRANGTAMDAVPYTNKSTTVAAWLGEVKALVAAAAWLPACPNNCAAVTDADSIAVDVATVAFGTASTGNSLQRLNNNVPAAATDWQMKAGSMGVDN